MSFEVSTGTALPSALTTGDKFPVVRNVAGTWTPFSVDYSSFPSGTAYTFSTGLTNTSGTVTVNFSSTTPAMDGSATVGTGTTAARSDHVHPTDTTRADTSLGNLSSATTARSNLGLTAMATLATAAQGSVVYMGASGPAVLAPGTSGNVLQTNGASANPTWAAGTALSAIANNTALANTSGGSAVPVATTVTALLDAALGSTQGMVLYRGASGWAALGAGTSGYALTSGGAGANPSWAPAGGSGTDASTLTTNATATGSIALTFSSTVETQVYDLTATGNLTFTLAGAVASKYRRVLLYVRGGTGGFTCTLPTVPPGGTGTVKWAGGAGAPSLDMTAGSVNRIWFETTDAGATVLAGY